jgi:hypothetical protein
MPGNYFWQYVESLSAAFDGSSDVAEENLNSYEQQALQFPGRKLAEVRAQFVQIIGGLSRLERRLAVDAL